MTDLALLAFAAVLFLAGRTLGSIRTEREWWAAEEARDRLVDRWRRGGCDG